MASRTLKKFVRTPALIVAAAEGVLFLLIFRYVFGGAISSTGNLSYVDFLVPGFVVTGVLFQGMSGEQRRGRGPPGRAVRPLALPADPAALHRDGPGRRADSALVAWGVVVMTVVGFASDSESVARWRRPWRRSG